jgi:CheY-like chemotaxis protein
MRGQNQIPGDPAQALHSDWTDGPDAPVVLRGRVLVVDDSSNGRLVLSRLLKTVGLEAETAADGRLGCQAAFAAVARGKPFDLILMDMQMPVMDGCEATRSLRAGGYAGRIIAYTACDVIYTRERCMQSGCDDYATKPITYESLLNVLRKNLAAAGNEGAEQVGRRTILSLGGVPAPRPSAAQLTRPTDGRTPGEAAVA